MSDALVPETATGSPDRGAVRPYPCSPELIPEGTVERGPYTLRFARSQAELEQAQQLRFEVFNLEMGEGFEESFATGRDEDRFDPVCHHLLVLEPGGSVIGTYRMQTGEMAARNIGFYSADEFQLAGLPSEIVGRAIEVGRACVAKDYRNRHVLFLLWQGLAAYMLHNRKRYLFGCCSLTSQDPVLGRRVMDHLDARGLVHPTVEVLPQPDWRCYDGALPPRAPGAAALDVKLPKLFSLYLRYGAKVCGPPALDRFFKTIDYLVLLDLEDLSADSRTMFFA